MNQTQNWARNLTYNSVRLEMPSTLSEAQEIVRASSRIKALGTRHSFSNIADTIGTQISFQNMAQVLDLNLDQGTVTLQAGMRYGELGEFLTAHGYALPNLASLPHISVVGACMTATHGSGSKNGNLATSVSGVDWIKADGSIEKVTRESNPDLLNGSVVSLGALGIVTAITLDIVPSYSIRQDVYDNAPIDEVLENFDSIMSGSYSTSLFTDWNSGVAQIWRKSTCLENEDIDAPATYFGGRLAVENRNPVRESSPINCTDQGGRPGPWNHRLPHFRMEFTPSCGEELQAEYFVSRTDAPHALRAILSIGHEIAPHLHISEIRAIASDDLWLSPCFRRESIAIHFTWHKDWHAVKPLMIKVDALLEPYQPRVHWGKLFTLAPQVLFKRYPRLVDFQELAAQQDPQGKFRNPFLDRYVLPGNSH